MPRASSIALIKIKVPRRVPGAEPSYLFWKNAAPHSARLADVAEHLSSRGIQTGQRRAGERGSRRGNLSPEDYSQAEGGTGAKLFVS
jgi:hypothetical protein